MPIGCLFTQRGLGVELGTTEKEIGFGPGAPDFKSSALNLAASSLFLLLPVSFLVPEV